MITAYGCGPEEAALVRAVARRLGVQATVTDAAVSEATVALAAGRTCVSVGHKTPIDAALVRALHAVGVRHISTRTIGLDHVDVATAERLGLSVGNVAYSPDSVADHTLMLVLMTLRKARSTVLRVAAHDYRLPETPGRELRDLTVGVVGTGRIGSAVIDRLRGFGCHVLTFDQRGAVEHVTLDELLRRSDVVTLHVPLDAGTHHLLDGARIARMKHGAHLVNTARGGLVDTEALVLALESGRLGGAALDVVEGEDGVFYRDCGTEPADRPLLARLHRLPTVVLTPHTAYYTDHALEDAVMASIVDCLRVESRQHA